MLDMFSWQLSLGTKMMMMMMICKYDNVCDDVSGGDHYDGNHHDGVDHYRQDNNDDDDSQATTPFQSCQTCLLGN